MCCVLIFLREDIGQIVGAVDMRNLNYFTVNAFADCVFADLDVSNRPACPVFTPENAGHVIIEYRSRFVEEFVGESEVSNDVA